MFKHILLPLDFTDKNDPAIAAVQELAGTMHSRVSLLHVIKSIEGVADREMEEFYELLEGRARMALTRLQADLGHARIESDYAIAYGKRTEEIVRCAGETGVDLIIMSSRKLDPDAPIQPWPTISHKVAVFAPCPVLLVR